MNKQEYKDKSTHHITPVTTETIASDKSLPQYLYLLPLSERPFFPSQTLPVILSESFWLDTIKQINQLPGSLGGLILTRNDEPENTKCEDFFTTGTLIRLHHPVRSSRKIQFIAEGVQRFRITRWISTSAPYYAQVEYPDAPDLKETSRLKPYAMALINTLKELMPLNPFYSEELKFFLNRFVHNDPLPLTDFAASLTSASKEELQEILEVSSLKQRMQKTVMLIKQEVEMAKFQSKISHDVEEKIAEGQRQFFLREQLKVIQKELGISKDDRTADKERYEERLAKMHVPDHAKIRINEETSKLAILETGSPEYAVTRNYLDIVSTLPWGVYSVDNLSLRNAKKILNHDHEGLHDIKERILEFIATGILRGGIAGSIILLVGPPGVGKTSVGRSIAHALNREFYRFSVGGMRDEAEIKGHRRTYIGAMPGKIIQGLREVGVMNPVIMLDEVDKIGSSFQGDPASALLEVLDPEQNSDFLDHYLDIRCDLSKVLFICTANQLDTIPRPLLDRMEVMRLSGYITQEKIAIAKAHLWPRQLAQSGIKPSQLQITDAALNKVIDGYAREAGVRTLDKKLNKITRKAAVKFVNKKATRLKIGIKSVENYLGQPIYQNEKLLHGVGVVTGLAWTAMGGATMGIEATSVNEKQRGFKLTGKLGEVMRESAEIAYSYISANAAYYGIDTQFFDHRLIHLHVPEGATPKDGPSAGITMTTALLSLARNQTIKRAVAMTGEITLTGQILAVGGIREKIVAARRNGVNELLIPLSVRADYEELPDYIKKGLIIHFVHHYKEVFKLLF